MSEPTWVYVRLLDEGTEVWRPVAAEPVSGDVFRLVGLIPDGERWEFQPGQLVHCTSRAFSNGEQALTVVAAADDAPSNSVQTETNES